MSAVSTASSAATREVDELAVNTIRTLAMDAVQAANAGHPGTPMALAPIAYVLYTRLLRHNPANPDWPDRDRFVLSAGHASMLLYSILFLSGYPGITLEDIRHFRQLGSPTAGHPERGEAPGIEATTGPLGQGISMSVGLALAERMLAERFNRDGLELVDHHTWTICSDGDLEEGIASEACSLAGHLGLGRLIAFYDDNHISIEGDTALAFSEDVGGRFEAYGWHVQNLGEDLGLDRIEEAARTAMAVTDRPSLIICRTHIAPGAPHLQDSEKAHGSPLGEEEVRLTKEVYGWPPDARFLIPEEVLEHFRSSCGARGAELEEEWNGLSRRYADSHPESHAQFRSLVAGAPAKLPAPPRVDPEQTPKMATRKAGHLALQWAAGLLPQLVGGSADLAPSTLTDIEGSPSVESGSYGGRNLHFGVREHGMGAIVNGLNLHYLRAYGSTFLIFSDYMKAAIRLAAIMHVPSLFIFTHDSVGLGEDGPTHQPIEQLATLRATPNLYTIRPAGAAETMLAFKFALEQERTPCALALSRQDMPAWPSEAVPSDAIERGAYVMREAGGGVAAGGSGDDSGASGNRDAGSGPDPEVVLIGTGAEAFLCVEAAELLEAGGIATRVVSMPCAERFEEQPPEYRDAVLPRSCRARVAVEAAAELGWHRWVGEAGGIVAMRSFGASGKSADVLRHFGFTPEHVAEEARAALLRAAEPPRARAGTEADRARPGG